VQAIHGLGGVGKTQTATEYAYRHETDYEVVLWVRSEEPTTLATDFAALSGKLGLVSPDIQDQNVHIEAALEWLRQNPGWLLIFDNAPDAARIVRYLPRGGSGHVLITSRNRDWRRYARTLQVRKMEPDEAIEFLLKRTEEQDRKIAARLAKELDYLPLALEQAAAYIDQRATSFSDYLALLQRHLARAFVPSEDYPKTVAATLEASFQAVREHSQAAADLLNLCAYFAPEDIPLDMIVAGTEHLPENLKSAVADEIELDSMIGELGRYSLVEVDRDRRAVSIHRMVQAVIRDNLPSEEKQRWVEAALQVVRSGFSYRINEMSTWPVSAIVLPHALAVIASSDLQEPGSTEIGTLLSYLLSQVGLYLRHRAQYTDARVQLARALAIDEAVYGPDHPDVATILNNLGSVLQDLGDLQGARFHYERALAIDEAVYGPDHPDVATILNNLGLVLQDLGDLQGARFHYERALAIFINSLGSEHPNTLVAQAWLARVNSLLDGEEA
jgi:tetratricopeptide (TPR) repeat protein